MRPEQTKWKWKWTQPTHSLAKPTKTGAGERAMSVGAGCGQIAAT